MNQDKIHTCVYLFVQAKWTTRCPMGIFPSPLPCNHPLPAGASILCRTSKRGLNSFFLSQLVVGNSPWGHMCELRKAAMYWEEVCENCASCSQTYLWIKDLSSLILYLTRPLIDGVLLHMPKCIIWYISNAHVRQLRHGHLVFHGQHQALREPGSI